MKHRFKSRLSKALLKVGYTCNNNCLFCHSAPHRSIDNATHELARKIRSAARMGLDMLVLSGGEPTVRPDLDRILEEIRRCSMALGLVTNGRMLAYGPVRKMLAGSGLEYLYVSIGSGTSRSHDRLTGAPGAFRQTLDGLLALLAEGTADGPSPEITLNCVVTRPSLEELDQVADLALELAGLARPGSPRLRLKFSAVEPEGNALLHYAELVPPMAEAASAVARTILRFQPAAARANLRLATDGFPPCLLMSLDRPERMQADLWTDGFVLMSEAMEDRWHPIDDRHKQRPAQCRSCSEHGCPGVFKTYLQRNGAKEFGPIVRTRSNSFDLTPAGQVRSPKKVRCPVIRGLMGQPDPRRELITRADDRWTLWRTETVDFTEAQLERIKNGMEQIYLDPGGTRGLDDFATQLKKLRLAGFCSRCIRRPACGGIFILNRPQPFASDLNLMDEHLTRIVTRHAGRTGTCRILDVGSGVSPYLTPIEQAARAGRAEYWGLDPVPPEDRLMREATAGSPERFCHIRGTAEQFTWAGPKFDAVLSIRSWAHFRSLADALSRILHPLRPGGLFYLVSDVPLGLLRAQDHADRCHDDKTLAFEHYRNHLMADTMEWLDSHGLELGFFRDAGPETTNLYFLVYRKPPHDR